jgi:hypothetical protein
VIANHLREAVIFNIMGVFGYPKRAKQPEQSPVEQYLAELAIGQVSDKARQQLEEWDRQQRDSISRSLDELVAQLPEDPE